MNSRQGKIHKIAFACVNVYYIGGKHFE